MRHLSMKTVIRLTMIMPNISVIFITPLFNVDFRSIPTSLGNYAWPQGAQIIYFSQPSFFSSRPYFFILLELDALSVGWIRGLFYYTLTEDV